MAISHNVTNVSHVIGRFIQKRKSGIESKKNYNLLNIFLHCLWHLEIMSKMEL